MLVLHLIWPVSFCSRVCVVDDFKGHCVTVVKVTEELLKRMTVSSN